MTLSDNTGGCTGTLISPKLVLTAAHCFVRPNGTLEPIARFYLQIEGTKAAEIRNGKLLKIGQYDLNEKNIRSQLSEDWAVVELDSPVVSVHTFPKLSDSSLEELDNTSLVMPGYPFDPDHGRDGAHGFVDRNCSTTSQKNLMEEAYPSLKGMRKSYFLTDCYSSGRNSGGPILIKNREKWEIVGIHQGWSTIDEPLFAGIVKSHVIKRNLYIGHFKNEIEQVFDQSQSKQCQQWQDEIDGFVKLFGEDASEADKLNLRSLISERQRRLDRSGCVRASHTKQPHKLVK